MKILSLLACLFLSFAAFAADTDQIVKTELYFGLSKPDGGKVTNEEWIDFLDTAVSPAFKDGLTALDTEGRYLDKDGKIRCEHSKLLILVHPQSPEKIKAIDALITLYKTRFKQESVLRTVSPVRIATDADAQPSAPLSEYARHNNTERLNDPADYIAYLKKSRFKNGELEHLPSTAIILHSAEPEKFVEAAGDEVAYVYEIGSASPNRLLVAKQKNGAAYLVSRGLPGAGGIEAQAAELGALGVKRIVHIGTCALLGGTCDEKTVIVSTGAYKDGAAVLLAEKERGVIPPLSRPEGDLAGTLAKALKSRAIPVAEGLGYSIPIYYYQPSGLIIELIAGEKYAASRPFYLEMEEATFFETAKRAGVNAASLIVPSDKYTLTGTKLSHEFMGDPGPALRAAFNAARDALTKKDE